MAQTAKQTVHIHVRRSEHEGGWMVEYSGKEQGGIAGPFTLMGQVIQFINELKNQS